jgi:hypothetical protein
MGAIVGCLGEWMGWVYEVRVYAFGIRLHSMYVRAGSMGNAQKKPFS